ncbi:MAG TPA: glycoside hydrolase family protein, partial [Lacunisphaera sp.]
AQDATPSKTFIDYFLPMPVNGGLSKDAWGSSLTGPRDQRNGLEDSTMKKWNYWDGGIIKGPDGKYHLFASRWEQGAGFGAWSGSRAVHAVSGNLFGPYVDKGMCWPDNEGGRGHNVSSLVLPDGRYAIVVSETRPGDVFVATSLDGPWTHLGKIQVADGPHKNLGAMSNVRPMVRPDGKFEIIARSGAIWISNGSILGPYVIQDTSIYPKIPTLKGYHDLEDPMLWHSGGLYHIIVNSWGSRKTFHLTSPDGISGWQDRGLAIDPTANFIRYTDGTVNHWANLERASVYLENGHVVAVTLAATDYSKNEIPGNSGHGSKILVLPFNGAALDKDEAAIPSPATHSSP